MNPFPNPLASTSGMTLLPIHSFSHSSSPRHYSMPPPSMRGHPEFPGDLLNPLPLQPRAPLASHQDRAEQQERQGQQQQERGVEIDRTKQKEKEPKGRDGCCKATEERTRMEVGEDRLRAIALRASYAELKTAITRLEKDVKEIKTASAELVGKEGLVETMKEEGGKIVKQAEDAMTQQTTSLTHDLTTSLPALLTPILSTSLPPLLTSTLTPLLTQHAQSTGSSLETTISGIKKDVEAALRKVEVEMGRRFVTGLSLGLGQVVQKIQPLLALPTQISTMLTTQTSFQTALTDISTTLQTLVQSQANLQNSINAIPTTSAQPEPPARAQLSAEELDRVGEMVAERVWGKMGGFSEKGLGGVLDRLESRLEEKKGPNLGRVSAGGAGLASGMTVDGNAIDGSGSLDGPGSATVTAVSDIAQPDWEKGCAPIGLQAQASTSVSDVTAPTTTPSPVIKSSPNTKSTTAVTSPLKRRAPPTTTPSIKDVTTPSPAQKTATGIATPTPTQLRRRLGGGIVAVAGGGTGEGKKSETRRRLSISSDTSTQDSQEQQARDKNQGMQAEEYQTQDQDAGALHKAMVMSTDLGSTSKLEEKTVQPETEPDDVEMEEQLEENPALPTVSIEVEDQGMRMKTSDQESKKSNGQDGAYQAAAPQTNTNLITPMKRAVAFEGDQALDSHTSRPRKRTRYLSVSPETQMVDLPAMHSRVGEEG